MSALTPRSAGALMGRQFDLCGGGREWDALSADTEGGRQARGTT